VKHLVKGSVAVGSFLNRFRDPAAKPSRWTRHTSAKDQELVQIR